MITPSFALTATERVLPRMALDFTTASLDSRVTFTRVGNTATVTNSSGVIAAINANLPRFDFDPTTLVCKGLLIEESRTNLLLNSLIDGTNLSTQLVNTTAVAHTLSFYGTGQIVLTGTSSATVVGTGAYPNRQTLTFTPTVGALTLTVTGTVQYAQLEVGLFVTSFISTAASQVTRTPDVATMTGANFSNWYNANEGSFLIIADRIYTGNFVGFIYPFTANDNTTSNEIAVLSSNGTTQIQIGMNVGGVSQLTFSFGLFNADPSKMIAAYKQNNTQFGMNGLSKTTDTICNVPTVTQLAIGRRTTSGYWSGRIQKLSYYPQRLISEELAAFTK